MELEQRVGLTPTDGRKQAGLEMGLQGASSERAAPGQAWAGSAVGPPAAISDHGAEAGTGSSIRPTGQAPEACPLLTSLRT